VVGVRGEFKDVKPVRKRMQGFDPETAQSMVGWRG
jgi:hypothetical protein